MHIIAPIQLTLSFFLGNENIKFTLIFEMITALKRTTNLVAINWYGITATFVLAQEVDALLQDRRLVHLAGVARQHGAQFLDEHIELVSPLLLRLVPRNSVGGKTRGGNLQWKSTADFQIIE